MKILLALATLLAVASAIPPDALLSLAGGTIAKSGSHSSKDATILKSDSYNIGVDGYHFDVETSDGLVRSEEGVIKTIGTESPVVMKGSIKWVGLDGTPYQLDFIADENGFQPTGSHLPH